MNADRRRLNRAARRRIRAREAARKRIETLAAEIGLAPLPWQIEWLVCLEAGPHPAEWRKQLRLVHTLARISRRAGKTATALIYDELRKDTPA